MKRPGPLLCISVLCALLVACTPDSTTPSTTSTTAATSTTATGETSTTTTSGPTAAAQIVLRNGTVITVNDRFDVAEAVAVRDGEIVAVGSDSEVGAHIGPGTVEIDLAGRSVVPGFIDPHTHLMHQHAYNSDLEGMLAAQSELLRGGTTTAGVPAIKPEDLEGFELFEREGLLAIRNHLYLDYNGVCGDLDAGDFYLSRPFDYDADLRQTVAGVKIFSDGGACNAPAFSDPYPPSVPEELSDRFRGTGDLYITSEEVERVVTEVDAAGGITVIHAIGDQANAVALAGLSAAFDAAPFSHHQRIDHNTATSLLSDEELAIYGKVGMVPVLFAVPWANGCDPATADLWRDLLPPSAFAVLEDSEAVRSINPDLDYSWHGDAPNISGTPLQLMFTLVTAGAVDLDTGQPCYPPDWEDLHTVPIDEGLEMVTINAAKAMGIDDRVGSIEVGKVADLLILREDPLDPDMEIGIATNGPLVTMINGEVYFCEGPLCPALEDFMVRLSETDPEPPPDTALIGLAVTVSASREGQGPELMFDGEVGGDSFWSSGEDPPQWVEVTFDQLSSIAGLRLHVFQNPESETTHVLELTIDGVTREVHRFEGFTASGDLLEWVPERPVENVSGFRVTTLESASWPEWYEIEITYDSSGESS